MLLLEPAGLPRSGATQPSSTASPSPGRRSRRIGYILPDLFTLRTALAAQSWLLVVPCFCAELAADPRVIHAELATHSYKRLISSPYRARM